MGEDQPPNVVVATLYGGPAGPKGRRITLRGVHPEQWPEYICVGFADGGRLEHHFRHIGGRVYEHAGPCLEFPDHVMLAPPRCPDCGSKVPGLPITAENHRHVE